MPTVIPPEFTEGAEVVCTFSGSEFYGQRGEIYGRGPHHRRQNETVFFVKWSNGARHQYRASSLTLAPKAEHLYRISNSNRAGIRKQVHEIPATSRGIPTIFERVRGAANDHE